MLHHFPPLNLDCFSLLNFLCFVKINQVNHKIYVIFFVKYVTEIFILLHVCTPTSRIHVIALHKILW